MCRAAQLQQTRRHHPLPRTLSFRRQRSLICVHSCPDRVQTALLAGTVLRCARRGPAGGHPGWRAPGARRTAWHAQRGRCLLPAPTRGRCRGATAWRAPSLAAPACRATRPRSWSQRSRRPAPADPINHVPGLADASMAQRTRGARQHVARMLALVSCPSSPLIFIAECCCLSCSACAPVPLADTTPPPIELVRCSSVHVLQRSKLGTPHCESDQCRRCLCSSFESVDAGMHSGTALTTLIRHSQKKPSEHLAQVPSVGRRILAVTSSCKSDRSPAIHPTTCRATEHRAESIEQGGDGGRGLRGRNGWIGGEGARRTLGRGPGAGCSAAGCRSSRRWQPL